MTHVRRSFFRAPLRHWPRGRLTRKPFPVRSETYGGRSDCCPGAFLANSLATESVTHAAVLPRAPARCQTAPHSASVFVMLRALVPSRCAPAPKVPAGARSPLSQRRRGAPLRALPFRRQQSVDPDDSVDDDSSLMAEFAAASAQFKPARTAAQRRFLEMGLRIRGRVRNCMGCGMRPVLAAAGRPRRSATVLTGSLLCTCHCPRAITARAAMQSYLEIHAQNRLHSCQWSRWRRCIRRSQACEHGLVLIFQAPRHS